MMLFMKSSYRLTRYFMALVLAVMTLSATGHLGTATAQAAGGCGHVYDTGGLAVLSLKANGTTCRNARLVASDFARNATVRPRKVADRIGRRWSCRITVQATNSDGSVPGPTRSSAVCTVAAKKITFKLAS